MEEKKYDACHICGILNKPKEKQSNVIGVSNWDSEWIYFFKVPFCSGCWKKTIERATKLVNNPEFIDMYIKEK